MSNTCKQPEGLCPADHVRTAHYNRKPPVIWYNLQVCIKGCWPEGHGGNRPVERRRGTPGRDPLRRRVIPGQPVAGPGTVRTEQRALKAGIIVFGRGLWHTGQRAGAPNTPASRPWGQDRGGAWIISWGSDYTAWRFFIREKLHIFWYEWHFFIPSLVPS